MKRRLKWPLHHPWRKNLKGDPMSMEARKKAIAESNTRAKLLQA